MPTWSEYKAIAKERGSLAYEVYRIETKLVASPQEMQKHLPDHLAYQKQLEAEGTLFLAGPTSDASGVEMTGGGMILYRAASIEEATKIAENDPMHKSGVRTFTVSAWLINEGSLSLDIKFAANDVGMK